jgi:hypothetical protein
MTDVNNAEKTYTAPTGKFKAGNPGRPHGARNRATALAQKMLHDAAGRLTEVAVDLALTGDVAALKLCMARLLPPVKDAPIEFELPEIGGAYAASCTATDILGRVASGAMTPTEGQAALALLETFSRICEMADIETRLAALEAATNKR